MAAASLLLLVYTAANLDWCWDMLSKPVASASMMMRPCQTYILLLFWHFCHTFSKAQMDPTPLTCLDIPSQNGENARIAKMCLLEKNCIFLVKTCHKMKANKLILSGRIEKSIWWLGQIVRLVCLSLGEIFGVLDSRDREEWAFKPFHIPFYYLFTTGEEVYCQAVFL